MSRTIIEVKEWCERAIKQTQEFIYDDPTYIPVHPIEYYDGAMVAFRDIIDFINNTSEETKK